MTGIEFIQHDTILIEEIINRLTIYGVCGINGAIVLVFITARHPNTIITVFVCAIAYEHVST